MNNKPRVVLIIQARMGSTRLPGKSMMPLAGEPLVGRILERVKRCRFVDAIVLAIPNSPQDTVLADLGERHGVAVFRGSENDLLDRYYQAAQWHGAEIVGRLPADNPVPEPEEIDRIAAYHAQGGCDFSSNLAPVFGNNYPDGIGAEMICFSALEQAWRNHHDPDQREHVHLNFFNYKTQQAVPPFTVGTIPCPAAFARPDLVLDVNTQEQYEFMAALYEYLYPRNPRFHITDVIQWYDQVYRGTRV
ncbi:MAG: glycosyltransferase family protein [Candidatus Omnitrophica bacterium]|nr:glycosyltransferase family protein [Candidatus Omnitrophota bacterium]